MADDSNTATTASEEQEQQITFNIKSSSEAKYVITVPASMTVAELKQKLSTSDYANIAPERQRLIYSGRVLKDPDTLNAVKIKDGNTVHLVKGAESNQRQNPASQGGASAAVPPGAGQPAANVPSNIAAGTGAGNPLAQLTGARYAGFHGLPGMDTFGADGGMGAPPNPDQMLRLLEDPNFASQMNEAMNNPAVIDMLRNNPMIRNNPMARQALENPELRRMMMNPEMIRMQMQMQRAMGGGMGGEGGGAGGFAMPGVTDTTPQNQEREGAAADNATNEGAGQTNAPGNAPPNPFAAPAGNGNPFAALFGGTPGANPGSTGTGDNQNQQAQANPFGTLFGQPQGGQANPFQQAAQQMMQNPQMMQQMMQAFGGAGTGAGTGGEAGAGLGGGTNPWAAMGGMGGMGGMGMGSPEPQAPPDTRPPEERYADQLRSLNDMGFFDFDRNVQALRRSGGSVQGAVEYLLSG